MSCPAEHPTRAKEGARQDGSRGNYQAMSRNDRLGSHNLVTVVKKNQTLHLCLDPRNLNKYLIWNVHYTASWEDAQHSFKNGQYFSMFDA